MALGSPGPQESDDALDLVEHRLGHRARPFRASGQDPIHVPGIGDQPSHLVLDRAELGDREIGEMLLEGRELLPAETFEHVFEGRVGERGVDADQVGGLGPVLESGGVLGQRMGLGARFPDLLGAGVGVVGVAITPTVSNARLKSFAIDVRTASAFL